jgi:hypothetical protein
LRITATSQRELTAEIQPLKEKIETTIDNALEESADPTDPEAFGRQRDEYLRPLLNLANAVGREMRAAADKLEQDEVADAGKAETAAVERLDELFMALTDYPHLLERAIEEQETLVDRVTLAVDNPDGQPKLDAPDVAWRQRFVADWARMLVLKARSGLARFQPRDVASGSDETANGQQTDQEETGPDKTATEVQAAVGNQALQEQLRPLRESMEKAVELGPQVAELVESAAAELDKNQPGEALPHQAQALKLLREIAEPLRREQPQQEKEQEKDKQDEQNQPEQPKEEKKPKEDQKKEETQEEPRQGQQQQEKRQRQPISEKEMQALLQNVRERKRKRDEELKKIRAFIARPPGVDKDW